MHNIMKKKEDSTENIRKSKKTKKNKKKEKTDLTQKHIGNNNKERKKINKILLISLIAALMLLFIFFGTKFFLYINFILGNDTIIKLSSDKEALSLQRGAEDTVKFDATVTTNLFCKANCGYKFIDISSNKTIDENNFVLRPSSPFQKQYTVKPTRLGNGIDIYRFDIECSSISTLLCHTKEEPTTRSIIVTLQYNLSDEEKILKKQLKEKLEINLKEFNNLEKKISVLNETLNELNKKLIINSSIDEIELELEQNKNQIQKSNQIWNEQDYYLLSETVEELEIDLWNSKKYIEEFDNELSEILINYQDLLKKLENIKAKLYEMRFTAFNAQQQAEFNDINQKINEAIIFFNQINLLEEKNKTVNEFSESYNLFLSSVEEDIKEQTLQKELETDIVSDMLCEITKTCIIHPSINELALKSEFNLDSACKDIDELRNKYQEINITIYPLFTAKNYSTAEDFWNNVSQKIINIKKNIIQNYLEELNMSYLNAEIIDSFLVKEPIVETETDDSIVPALFIELNKYLPDSCKEINITFETLNDIIIEVKEFPVFNILFEEPSPRACIFNKCEGYCETQDCRNDPDKFPVLFLHGHAVNKESSAEYSLEGFNEIQKKLEEQGYINAGSITLFTARNIPEGILGLPNAPLTLRVSYYFDVFKQPENYIVVQAKSENIEAYSIRLKELIDEVKYKTAKPKVKIIAFSMGGLVARKYLQLFGDNNVDRLILIGTPNKGISGNVADYCPIVGEKLECEDMNVNSLFMNKLNRGNLPDMPIYNIIGVGCEMGKETGDGTVLKENALLEGAKNYIINGTCRSKIRPLHLDLRDINLYPEVYDIISKALKE